MEDEDEDHGIEGVGRERQRSVGDLLEREIHLAHVLQVSEHHVVPLGRRGGADEPLGAAQIEEPLACADARELRMRAHFDAPRRRRMPSSGSAADR